MSEVYVVRVWLVVAPSPANLPPSSELLQEFGARFSYEVEWDFEAMAFEAADDTELMNKINGLFDRFRAIIAQDHGLQPSQVGAITPFTGGWIPGTGGLHEGDSPVYFQVIGGATEEWTFQATSVSGKATKGFIRARCEWKKTTVQ